MGHKRKHSTIYNTPSKRRKSNAKHNKEEAERESSQNSDGSEYYTLKNIIGENSTEYHIDWEGVDPDTGRPYEPTWIPKEYANREAVEDWERQKREKAPSASNPRPSRRRKRSSSPVTKEAEAGGSGRAHPPKRRGRKRRIADSSSSPYPEPTPGPAHAHEAQNSQEIPETQQTEQAELESIAIASAPLIQISPPSTSQKEGYESLQSSQIPEQRQESYHPASYPTEKSSSAQESARQTREDSALGSSSPPSASEELSESQAFQNTRAAIIPDSQSLENSGIFIPTSTESVDVFGGSGLTSNERSLTSTQLPSISQSNLIQGSLSNPPLVLNSDPIEETSSLPHQSQARDGQQTSLTTHLTTAAAIITGEEDFTTLSQDLVPNLRNAGSPEASTQVSSPNSLFLSQDDSNPNARAGNLDFRPEAPVPEVEYRNEEQVDSQFIAEPSAQHAGSDIEISSRQVEPDQAGSGIETFSQLVEPDQAGSGIETPSQPVEPDQAGPGIETPSQPVEPDQAGLGIETPSQPVELDQAGSGVEASSQPVELDSVRPGIENFSQQVEPDHTGSGIETSRQSDPDQVGSGLETSLLTQVPLLLPSSNPSTSSTSPQNAQIGIRAAGASVETSLESEKITEPDPGQNSLTANSESQETLSSILSRRDPNSQTNLPTAGGDDNKFPDLSKLACENTVHRPVTPTVSQSIEVNTPIYPRPSTPSNDMMDTSQESTPTTQRTASESGRVDSSDSSLREKLRHMRANSAANVISRRRNNLHGSPLARVSSSTIAHTISASKAPTVEAPLVLDHTENVPSIENDLLVAPVAPAAIEDVQMLAEEAPPLSLMEPRALDYNTDQSEIVIHPSQLLVETDIPQPKRRLIPRSPQLGRSEFVVPLPMDARVGDEYQKFLQHEGPNIWKLISASVKDSSSIDPSQQSELNSVSDHLSLVIKQLNNVTTHPDLNMDGEMTQAEQPTAEEATWAELSSPKFKFLGYFFEAARDQKERIVIMAREGQTLNILETYLKGRSVNYCRFGRRTMTHSDFNVHPSPLEVWLLPTGSDLGRRIVGKCVMIIAFDSSFSVQDQIVDDLRSAVEGSEQFTPVIYPLVTNSAEHLGRCLPDSLRGLERLKILVRCAFDLRRDLGQLDEEDGFSPWAAAGAIANMLDIGDIEGNWRIPPIEELDLDGLEAEMFASESQSQTESVSPARVSTPADRKRLLDGEEVGTATSKRQRLTPLQDMTHISDSMKDPQSQIDELGQRLKTADQTVSDLKIENSGLQNSLSVAQNRLKTAVSELSTHQHRFEGRTNELQNTRRERDGLLETIKTAERRREMQNNETTKLRDERTELKNDLQAAREALKTGGGSVAELEAAKEETRKLAKEKASLEKAVESKTRDFEYTSQQYQTASTVAAEHASQLTLLEAENAELKRKANAKVIEHKEWKSQHDNDRHLSRIAELESMLSSREELLRRKEEELRDLRKNRSVATRASSVQPRSPRLGNSRPESPAPGALVVGRGSALRFERP